MGFKSWIIPDLSLFGLKGHFVECEQGMTWFSRNWSYLWVLLRDVEIRPHLFNLMYEDHQNITVIMYKQRS